VGDRYVLEDMLKLGSIIGGEDSGHMIFLRSPHHRGRDPDRPAAGCGHGLDGKPLSELAKLMDIYPQKLINVDVKSKPDISTVPRILEAIERAEKQLGEQGRVLVRYSGTQNMCRVMVEGPSDGVTEKHCMEIADVVRSVLG